jgi:signal transduction histidine kinase
MNIYGITQIISGIFSLLLGVFVFYHNKKSPVNKSYALVSLLLSGWCISYFVWQLQTKEIGALFWLRILMTFMAYIHSAYLQFVLYITNLFKQKIKILIFSYIWSIIFSILFLSGFGFSKNTTAKLFAKFWPDANLLTLLFLIVQLTIVTYGLYILFTSIKHSFGRKKNQLKYYFTMFLFAWVGGSTNWFLWFDIRIPPLGNPFVTLYLAVIAYAILRHKLLDINIAIRKGLIYSVLISLITISYVILALLVETLFRGIIGYRSLPITILIITLLVVFFQPLKNYIQKFIDKYFFHGTIDQIDEENVKLREELQKTEKLKAVATLAAGMAHEIKNPLTSIKTFTEYLPEKKNDPAFLLKFQRIVGSEVDKINNIVQSLLEFSKPKDLHLEESSINSLLEETLSLLSNDFLKHDIKIEKNLSSLPQVKVDPSQMKQVFLNVLLNAIDSIKNGGMIMIETKTEKKVFIKIKDSGRGIDKEDLKRIFDPFFSKKDRGTGLGLSVVHGIIKKHGGKINVESAPGKGTRFEIVLPITHR